MLFGDGHATEDDRHMTDIIEDIKNSIIQSIPTNHDWAEACAISIVNAIIGPHICCHTEIGELNSNLFFLNIGPSGLGNKTTVMKYYVYPILKEFQNRVEGADILRSSRFSIEGMVSELKEHNSGIIVRDEFSSMFKDANKGYIGDILEFLSQIFDGMTQRRVTKSGGVEQVSDIYVSLLSATTEYVFSIMNLSFFVQGTGNRFMYVVSDPTFKETNPDFFYGGHPIQRQKDVESFVDRLIDLHNKLKAHRYRAFILHSEKLVAFRNEILNKTKQYHEQHDELMEKIYSRLPEFAIKLTTIKGAVNEDMHVLGVEGFDSVPNYPVQEEAVDWAINKVRIHMEHIEKLKAKWRITPDRQKAKTDEETIEYVMQVLREENRSLGADEWCKLCHMKWNVWKPIVETLLGIKYVEFVDGKYKVSTYRPTD